MALKEFIHSWKAFVSRMNALGIPMPLIRDPKTGQGSVSLTLLFLASIWVQVGLIGKYSKLLGDINIDQSMQFFYATSALYFGRNLTTKNTTFGSSIETKEDK